MQVRFASTEIVISDLIGRVEDLFGWITTSLGYNPLVFGNVLCLYGSELLSVSLAVPLGNRSDGYDGARSQEPQGAFNPWLTIALWQSPDSL